MTKSEKASNQWQKANKAFTLYQEYLTSKGENRLNLTVVDLLFISNFKGGSSTIADDARVISTALEAYTLAICQIDQAFHDRTLGSLTEREIDVLIQLVVHALRIVDENPINGFYHSFFSALLCSMFPSLLPIIDKWIIPNLELAPRGTGNWQIDNIGDYYPEVIRRFHHRLSKEQRLSVRELDKRLFIERPE